MKTYLVLIFFAAVASGGEPPIPFESLRATTLAAFRVRESLRCGKALPVSPFDPA
jgi:hypothetical protein